MAEVNPFAQFREAEPEADPMSALRKHAEANISAGTVARDPEGNPATVRSGSVNNSRLNEGKATLIPFQWNGKIVDQAEAERLAIESGIEWPSFESHEEATKASKSLSESLQVDKPENPFAQFQSDEPIEATPAEDPGLQQIAPGIFIRADRSLGDYITGATSVIGAIGSSIVAEPASGLAGLGAAIHGGAQAGAETVESTREAMTYRPGSETGQEMMGAVGSFLEPVGEALSAVESGIGESVLEATGSPLAASLAHAAPTALLEMLGLGWLKKPSQAAMRAAKAQERIRIDPDMTPEQAAMQMIEAEDLSYTQIAEALKQGEKTKVAEAVRPDWEALEAGEALGMSLNPADFSTAESFQRVWQAVKSQPGTKIAAREVQYIKELGERADELIGEFGGSLDKSLLDVKVRSQVDGTLKDLKKAAEETYKQVGEIIKEAAGDAPKVNARASKAYITARLEELGGDVSGLSKSERMLHQVLNQDRPPTYARLDQLRRDVGAGFKQKGQFADDLSGNLDQVYGALITDQQGIATALGAGDLFRAGRKLVETRKQLEKQAMQMFGREMNRSFLPKLTQSATALTKGDTQQFKNLMAALPENMRTPAAATLVNDLFTHGSRTGGSIGAGFARAFDALGRNAGAKDELFKYLPAEARRRFDAIGTVSSALYRVKALENTSKTARDILLALENGGMVSRIVDKTTDTVLGRMTFMPGPTRWVAAGVKAVKTIGKEAMDATKAADTLMASQDFARAINKAAEGSVKQAEIMLKRSAVWRAYQATLGESTKTQLAAIGPIAWLTQQDDRQEGQPVGQ
jgi:hypothetical protein